MNIKKKISRQFIIEKYMEPRPTQKQEKTVKVSFTHAAYTHQEVKISAEPDTYQENSPQISETRNYFMPSILGHKKLRNTFLFSLWWWCIIDIANKETMENS